MSVPSRPGHARANERVYSVNTECFLGDDAGNVRALRAHEVEQRFASGRMTFEKVEGSDFELPCELVLLAMGFVGPQREGLLEGLGVEINERGNVTRDAQFRTNLPNVFVAGDMGRGQSLIVWAIAEGRSCRGGGRRVPHGCDAAPGADRARRRPHALTPAFRLGRSRVRMFGCDGRERRGSLPPAHLGHPEGGSNVPTDGPPSRWAVGCASSWVRSCARDVAGTRRDCVGSMNWRRGSLSRCRC